MWWFPSKNICQKSSGSVFMNCWRSLPCWSLIFCKTYKFLCNMWCVMCVAWCVMFPIWFFVRSWLYELRGDQKHPNRVISDLFNDIQKSIPGGSHMYTISCKASYEEVALGLSDAGSWTSKAKGSFAGEFMLVLDKRAIGEKDALPCKFCDMTFDSCKELVKHKTKKLKGEGVHPCDVCDKGFKSSPMLNQCKSCQHNND